MFESAVNVQKLVVAKVLRSKKALTKVCSIANERDFTHKELCDIFKYTNKYFIKYGQRITKTELKLWNKKRFEKLSVRKDVKLKVLERDYKIRKTLIKNLYDIETFASINECVEQFIQYKEEKEFGDALWDATDIHERTGDVQRAKDLLIENLNKSYNRSEFVYSDYLENWEDRQEKRLYIKKHPEKQIVIPTGYKQLDRTIRGIIPGELFTVIATTGKGKSIFLMQQAYISLLYNFDVIFITLENTIQQIEQRLDSRISKIKYDALRDMNYTKKELIVANNLFDTIRKEIQKKILIYSVPQMTCNSGTIVRIWQDALRRGINRRRCVIILDYLDLVTPINNIKEKRLADAHVYRAFKSFLTQEMIPAWTASQAVKEAEGKIALSNAIAEAYEKARIADGILSLNQDELQQAVGEGILWVGKMRDHPADFGIPILMDKAYMAIREDRVRIKQGQIQKEKSKKETAPIKQ